MNLEHYRKEAKRLRRAFAAGDPRAFSRAEAALGERSKERFLLSDAQHVIAVERGYRSWPELRRAAEPIGHPRTETVIDTGLEYRPGDAVRVRVVQREHRIWVVDDGVAFDQAGRPRAWQAAADRVHKEFVVNISRHGVISLPVMRGYLSEQEVVRRIAKASLALYQEILDLEGATAG